MIIFRTCALVAYVPLLLIHFILKDHFRSLQVIFYAFPLPILIVIGIFITLLFCFKPRIHLKFIFGLLLGITFMWLNNSYIFKSITEIPEDATSVLFWNAADGPNLPVDVLLESIKNIKPDIIGLVEAENASEEDIQKLSQAFPDYEFRILEGFMLVGIRGHIEKITYIIEEYSYDINFVKAQLKTGPVLLALTDTFQDPAMDKRKTLNTVFQLVTQKNSDIIVSDFNTPYESVHFRSFKKEYNSFHDYGQGFTATWPYGIPLLEIDQIYVNKTLNPILLKKFNYKVSDHAMLVGYFK